MDLLDLLIVLARHKPIVFGLPLLAGILAVGITLSMRDVYTGSENPPSSQNLSAASLMLSQLNSMTGGVGGVVGGALPVKIQRPLYWHAEEPYGRRSFNRALQSTEAIRAEPAERACGRLEGRTTITAGKERTFCVEVDDYDPKFQPLWPTVISTSS